MSIIIEHAKRAYGALPMTTRSWAASAYGLYLRLLRYDLNTDRRVAEALVRDDWGSEDWRRYRDERLQTMLVHAATRVPYYRDHWRQRRLDGDDAPWDDLRHWPILEKEAVRSNPEGFLADGIKRARTTKYETSGTTGTPITTWRDTATNRAWYALFEARIRRWNGVDRGMRWAILGGQPVVPMKRSREPFWVWNAGLRQLYLSANHVSPDNAEAFLTAMRAHRVEYLLGYPSSIHVLACAVLDRGVLAPLLRVIMTNAELLTSRQRARIHDAFGCNVRDTYGMVELVAAGSECDQGVVHAWPEVGVIEVLGDAEDLPLRAGEVGQFVCTGLLNPVMPLIRYRVGDRGALADRRDDLCACGRGLPVIERLDGRSSDSIVTTDGRRVFAEEAAFDRLDIRERQLVQYAIDRLEVLVVPGPLFNRIGDELLVIERLRRMLGDVKVTVRLVERIPRGPNGKFKSLVSHVDLRMRDRGH